MNIKKGVPIIKKRFEYALSRVGYSKNFFSKIIFSKVKQPLRKLQKYLQTQEIPLEILEDISCYLNVDPDYLKGTYNVTKEELQKDFGDKFSNYFTDNDFDPEGFNYHTFDDYLFHKKQFPIDEHLITYLNHEMYCVSRDESLAVFCQFDFHDLDRDEFRILRHEIKEEIRNIIESEYLRNPSAAWRKFIETAREKGQLYEVKQNGKKDI